MTEVIYDVVIIGSGPAGYTAAIYASRAQLKTVLIAGDEWGGQLMLTSEVENYPGFAEAILGPKLMQQMRDQAKRFGAEFVTDQVEAIQLQQAPYQLQTATGKHYQARTVIVATGSQSKWLGLPSEQRLMAKGVTSCATCDGFFFTDKTVAVVGGGDTAMEEALELTKYAKTVTIIHRRHEFRASKIMQQRVLTHPKVKVIWDHEVTEVLGDDFVRGVRLKHAHTGAQRELAVDGLFVAIGHQPATAFLRGQLPTNEQGYIVPAAGVKTALPGVFVAGDVADPRYRQAITAAGDGCRAALEAERYLMDLESVPAAETTA